VKDLDAAGLVAWVDGGKAALCSVGTLGHAIPALLGIAVAADNYLERSATTIVSG
jgi:hypothetical protein